MFTRTEQYYFKSPYFYLEDLKEQCCVVRSRNSRQYWMILKYEDETVSLLHKHREKDRFHMQRSFSSVAGAIRYIVQHDGWTMIFKGGR